MSGETVLTIIGALTADPELRFLASGQAVASFTVASNARHFDKATNEWVDSEPLFMRCSIWRQPAENVAECLTRGMRVIVTGRLKQRSFEKDGVNRTVIELEVDEIGPSVKFATVKVNRADRQTVTSGAKRAPSDDPWGSAPKTSGGGFGDEPPF